MKPRRHEAIVGSAAGNVPTTTDPVNRSSLLVNPASTEIRSETDRWMSITTVRSADPTWLTLSLGGEETRNVFVGIKGVYEPEQLVGRLVICCANLKPRKMRFGISEGMVLASGPGGQDIYLLSPDDGAKPGMRVH